MLDVDPAALEDAQRAAFRMWATNTREEAPLDAIVSAAITAYIAALPSGAEPVARELLLTASIHLEEWPGNDDASQRDKAMRIVGKIDEYLAAFPQSSSQVTVKALVWREHVGDGIRGGVVAIAEDALSQVDYQAWGDGSWSGLSGFVLRTDGTLDTGKAAAKSDYEARILSALSPPVKGDGK